MESERIPFPVAILLCDTIITDAKTTKKTLVGIFESFNLPQLPSAVAGYSFFARLADMEGKYYFRINVVSLEGDKSIAVINSSEINVPAGNRYIDLALTMPQITFEKAGLHEFQLLANEIYLGRVVIEVRKMEEK
jgi:hypothetical protein